MNNTQPYGKLWQWAHLPPRWHTLLVLLLSALVLGQSVMRYQQSAVRLATQQRELDEQRQTLAKKRQLLTALEQKQRKNADHLKQQMASVVPEINRQLLAYVAQFPQIKMYTPQWQFDQQTTLALQFSGPYLSLDDMLSTLFERFTQLTPLRLSLQAQAQQSAVHARVEFFITNKESQ
ncbi:hypothetical protein HPC38_01195 [Pasteurellaceae bacterium HPA106]|uniref:hypothetical protein n=1 Tax=Spirabiliibacterium pneumoniae TaxID=221400 RepID=UPI001AADFD54|nr:hypothetical protein [Spirabiliibacterium pneumoniae]MBE2895497.1 hypothetical protein [Spirabiliibacterium pneumoniae]